MDETTNRTMKIASVALILWMAPLVQSTPSSLRGSLSSASNVSPVSLSPSSRYLMAGHHKVFHPLSCNDQISSCVNWSSQDFDTSAQVTIPCDMCVTMDVSGPTLSLPGGLNIEGKLVFPDGYRIEISTPHVFVQGELQMKSTRPTSSEPDIKIVLTGSSSTPQTLIPHPDNSANCDGGCSMGGRPVAVAGGLLNIAGLPESCPSWVPLKNVIKDGPSDNINLPTFTQPAPGCTTELTNIDFENGSGIGWPNHWYRNYGGTDAYIEDDVFNGNTYALFGGRNANWNGPQTNFDPTCIVPEETYFFYARARLTKPGGTSDCATNESNCLKLTSFMQEADGQKRWNNIGTSSSHEDGTWFDFTATWQWPSFGNDPNALARRVYWEGPESGVEIALDNVRIWRAGESTFPNPNTSTTDYCQELVKNGDAEDTTLHPFTLPFKKKSGTGVLQIGAEGDGNNGLNHYYAMSNRGYDWDHPAYVLPQDCVAEGSVYSISIDIRTHATTPVIFGLQFTVTKEDGSETYPKILQCPSQTASDGWKTCSGMYSFRDYDETASRIEVYPVSANSITEDADFDNFFMTYQSGGGKVTDLIVPGQLESCWGPGSEIVLTSNGQEFDDTTTLVVGSTTNNFSGGTTRITLETPTATTPSYADNEPDYATEVALLSRNIEFTSDDESNIGEGGHLIIYHTNRAQSLQGVALRKFGQQGTLGKYPVHFHMCGSADSSIVSKMLVRDSNQRCYVIHGTHNVTLDSNVAYETRGHCFMLEDHAEMDNTLSGNLAVVTRKVTNKISPAETDDIPSAYWITNPINTFLNNVAAGSEHSGFWFEMDKEVRGPSANLVSMNPSTAPLTKFDGNVAHSCSEHGVKTYPGHGYDPIGEPAKFENIKSYRNRGDGMFIHNSENIAVIGGLFADNRRQIDVDRSPSCSVDGARIVGVSPEFAATVAGTNKLRHCPSSYPIRGVELHTYWLGGDKYTGTTVSNTSFEHFGDTGCDGTAALRVDDYEDKGYFDVRTAIDNVSFDPNTPPLTACDGVDAGIDAVIHDEDGSILGSAGFILADMPSLTTLAPSTCSLHSDSCTFHCPNTCFRTMGFAISTLAGPSVLLEIEDINTNEIVTLESTYEVPLDDDGNVRLEEHTKSHRNNRYFATLSSGGDYKARFVKNGEVHWPVFVDYEYEDVGSTCAEFNSFTLVEPSAGSTCDQLIKNGDMEDVDPLTGHVKNWVATMGGVVSDPNGVTGKALTSEYRTASWMGPAQYLDTRCMTVGTQYHITAEVKMVDSSDNPVSCNPGDTCPKFIMKLESGTYKDRDERWHFMGQPSTWVTGNWNTIDYTFTVSQEMANAGSVLLYSESNDVNVFMVFDDVSVKRVV